MTSCPDYLDPERRVRDIADCRNNVSDLSIQDAARNLINDVPAYWRMPGGMTGVSAKVCDAANFQGSLKDALLSVDAHGKPLADRIMVVHDIVRIVYDQLIPLNMAAVEELDMLYRAASTFPMDDLRTREERAVLNPIVPASHNPKYLAMVADVHAEAQLRFYQRQEHFNAPAMQAAE